MKLKFTVEFEVTQESWNSIVDSKAAPFTRDEVADHLARSMQAEARTGVATQVQVALDEATEFVAIIDEATEFVAIIDFIDPDKDSLIVRIHAGDADEAHDTLARGAEGYDTITLFFPEDMEHHHIDETAIVAW